MKRTSITAALLGMGLALCAGDSEAQDLQQKVAAAKQAAAQNQQALHAYSWVEKTEIALKGEVKNTKLESCRYGPDGKVQKTLLSAPPEPQKQRGLKGRMVEKKTEEMKGEMQAAGALVHQYLPPAPDKIQAAMAAGKITVAPGAATALRIADYLKPGDALTLTLAQGQGMQHLAVNSYLDSPDKAVKFDVQMQSLPDGTSHPGTIVLAIPSDNIEVRITNSNYQKLAQ
jgi:hypothetical protein